MEIKIPNKVDRRKFPPESEVRDVVGKICDICGYDSNRVILTYVGGQRRRFISFRGIKLIKHNPFTIQLYIGCTDEALEAHLQVNGDNGRAIPGFQVYKLIEDRLGRSHNIGRYIDHSEILQTDLNDSLSPNVEDESSEPNPDHSQVDKHITQDVSPTENDGKEQQVEEKTGEQESGGPVYKYFFDDPARLHLTTCALVMICNTDTNAPWPFKSFMKALEDSNVPKTAGVPGALFRSFLYRDLVKRINPDEAPARYVITDKAVKFAQGNVPEFVEKKPRSTKSSPEPSVKKVRTDTIQVLRELKDIVNAHTEVLNSLESARSKLVDLRSVDIETQENRIDEEMSQIQTRLEQLKIERQLLAKRRLDIKSLEKEINSLTQKAEDPEVLDAKRQLDELRALLG